MMPSQDPRIDTYIERSSEFARPILRYLRDVVHSASPDIEETMKWSTPHFTYQGMLCHMAAFKQHCAFGFWKGSLLEEVPEKLETMGHFGRITSISDLPPKKKLVALIREAMKLNEEGISVARKPAAKTSGTELEVPEPFRSALDQDPQAKTVFDAFSPSRRREYVEWIGEAKREDTRTRRTATAIEWLREGKSRNWQYEKS